MIAMPSTTTASGLHARLRRLFPAAVAVLTCVLALIIAGQAVANDPAAAAVETIKPRQAEIALQVGQRHTVEVEVTPAAAAQPLRYESGNAGFFTVDDKGVITAVHEGTSALSIIAPSGARAEVKVTVRPAGASAEQAPAAGRGGVANQGILIGNAGGSIEVGRVERIIAHVLPHQVIGSNPFTLASSDPSVIAVIDDAKVINAIKPGTATITASTLDGSHSATVSYTVVPARTWDVPADKTYTIEPQRFGIRYDDASEEAAKANSAGLYAALKHTADSGNARLLLEPNKVIYIEPRDTIHMVSNVQLDLNGSELRLRPNDYPRYVAILFAEKDNTRVLENASIVNGTITGERDEKEQFFPDWAKTPATEAGCSIVFEEGYNNGIRNLTVRKSIGFNISSGLGTKSHGVVHFAPNAVAVNNMEDGNFDDQGQPTEAAGHIRTIKPIDISKLQSPHYTLGYPLGYMGYPHMNSRIYDAWFYDKDMNLLAMQRGQLRFRQYALPAGSAFLHLSFPHDGVPKAGNSDFHNAFAFVENRAMPIDNYMIGCTIEDNYSTGFAACGGQGWIIRDNLFRRNSGRMPGCDIDWEDGWEYMQGDLIEGNTFESRLNVITCAGSGLVFRNNTFRGESIFYGRSQNYSLIDNVFEKGEGEKAHNVKVAFSSQTDIYAVGNRYTNAAVSYTKQHAKEPFIGTYEATFTREIFDNTAILNGHLTRVVNCTFRNGSEHLLISAEHLENCAIEAGSYIASGVIRNSTITDATFRVAVGKQLTVENSNLRNPAFSAGGPCEGLVIDNCRIAIDTDGVLVTPNDLAAVTIRNSQIAIKPSAWTLVGGWNAAGVVTEVKIDRVKFAVPSGFQGYLHKFSWYPPASDGAKMSYEIRNTDISRFRRTDEKGEKSNARFNVASR